MRFTDRTLLRLLDQDELRAMLNEAAGGALLHAAYVFDDLDIGDVDTVVARTISLAPAVAAELPFTLTARAPGVATEWQVTGSWHSAAKPLAHAVLEISVTAAARGVTTSVTEVAFRSLTDLRPALAGATTFDDALDVVADRFPEATREGLAEVLRRRGIDTLEELQAEFAAPNEPTRLRLALVSDATAPRAATIYRLTAAAQVVENLATELAEAVMALVAAREALGSLVDPPSRPRGVSLRQGYPGLVIFPVEALDDADLPFTDGPAATTDTARRASRLTELTTRLRSAGIVPVAV